MMCKFVKQPMQDPRLGLKYVAGAIDAKGVAHDEVTLVRGVPADFVRVASGLTFNERYKSFIASWSPGDEPDAEQMERVVRSLERLLFGDLDTSRFSYVVYVHRKNDKVDLHALIANVELASGLHFNAAPPRWQGSFDAWRDMHNAREGWASPADPKLARKVQPGVKPHFKSVKARNGGSTPPSYKAQFNSYALNLVDAGLIASRDELIDALALHGKVNRVNPNFISIIPPELGRPIRLKGAIFEDGFDFAAAVKRGPSPGPSASRSARTSKDHEADRDPVAEERARKRFEAAVARRHTDNVNRFAPRKKRAFVKQRDVKEEPDRQDVPQEEFAPAAPLDLGMHDAANGFDPALHQAAEAIASAAGRMRPQLLRAIPSQDSNDISNNTKKDDDDRSNRSATSRGIAALVRDLRERFEQLARRVVELGAGLRRKRWLHAPRFDDARDPGDALGATLRDADAARPEEASTVMTPVLSPGRRP